MLRSRVRSAVGRRRVVARSTTSSARTSLTRTRSRRQGRSMSALLAATCGGASPWCLADLRRRVTTALALASNRRPRRAPKANAGALLGKSAASATAPSSRSQAVASATSRTTLTTRNTRTRRRARNRRSFSGCVARNKAGGRAALRTRDRSISCRTRLAIRLGRAVACGSRSRPCHCRNRRPGRSSTMPANCSPPARRRRRSRPVSILHAPTRFAATA